MRDRLKKLLALLAVFLLAVPSTLADAPVESFAVEQPADNGEIPSDELDSGIVVSSVEDEAATLEPKSYLGAELIDGAGLSEDPTNAETGGSAAPAESGDGEDAAQTSGNEETNAPAQTGGNEETNTPAQSGENEETNTPAQSGGNEETNPPAQVGEGDAADAPAQTGEGSEASEGEASEPTSDPASQGEAGEEPAASEERTGADANETDSARLLSAQSLSIGLKEKRQLKVGDKTMGAGSGYLFTSSNGAVVAVNGVTGQILGKKKGTATITLTGGGVSETCVVTVKKAPTTVKLNVKKLSLSVGMSYRLTGKLSKNSASALHFSSSNTGVATVDANGVIAARGKGTAVITVKTFNGRKAKCKLTVKPAPTSVGFNRSEIVLGVGQKVAGGAVINTGSLASISYASGDPAILEVSGSSVKGVTVGETTLTATTHNGCTATVKVRVLPAPTSVTLPQTTIYMGLKEKRYLKPSVNQGSCSTYTYSTSKKKVATVNSAGRVTAKKKGTAVITVKTYNGLTVRCTIKVVKVPKKVSLSPASMTLGVGQSGKLKASLPSGSGSAISFSSSNTRVATVDGSGNVRTVSPGTAVITARTFNGKTAKSRITVLPEPTSVQITLGSNKIYNGYSTSISGRVNSGAAGSVTLTADPASYVTISGGKVTANARGLAIGEHRVTITGTTYNGVSASVELTIVVRNRYRALLIGQQNISGYRSTNRNAGDVQLMMSMLESIKGPTGESYEITTRTNLSSSATKAAIESTFANSTDSDVLLFFIATHGDTTSTGENAGALVMAGGNRDMLTLPTLAGWLSKVNGKVIVIVVSAVVPPPAPGRAPPHVGLLSCAV